MLIIASTMYLAACGGGGDGGEGTSLPYGSYSSDIHDLTLSTTGTFSIVHRPTSYDNRNYIIEGAFTSTLDVNDPSNATYGKITLTVARISSGGVDYDGIDDPFCESSSSCYRQIALNDSMKGWWAYSSNVTWGGSFSLWFNDPGVPRGTDPYAGHNMLISVDP